ncbi:hypothetical protein U1Q18_003736 [Sarracenia purpurea var. burkii]
MATTSTPTDHAANSASVDAALWWESFTLLLTELENASPASDLPPHLVKKLKDNHAWFLDTVSCFKPQNDKSREALNSRQVNVGSHQLTVQPELRTAALKISSILEDHGNDGILSLKRNTPDDPNCNLNSPWKNGTQFLQLHCIVVSISVPIFGTTFKTLGLLQSYHEL